MTVCAGKWRRLSRMAALCGAPRSGRARSRLGTLPVCRIAMVAGAHCGAIVVSRAEDLSNSRSPPSHGTPPVVPDAPAVVRHCYGEVPIRRRADGTVGPIGYTGDDAWAYTLTGRAARTCAGAVVADGSCVSVGTEPHPATPFDRRPAISRSRGAGDIWRIVPPGMIWQPEFEVPPTVVTDGAGMAYTTLDTPRRVTGTRCPPEPRAAPRGGAITPSSKRRSGGGGTQRTAPDAHRSGNEALRSDGTTAGRAASRGHPVDEELTDRRGTCGRGTSEGLTRRVTPCVSATGASCGAIPRASGAPARPGPGGPTMSPLTVARGVGAGTDARGRVIWRLGCPEGARADPDARRAVPSPRRRHARRHLLWCGPAGYAGGRRPRLSGRSSRIRPRTPVDGGKSSTRATSHSDTGVITSWAMRSHGRIRCACSPRFTSSRSVHRVPARSARGRSRSGCRGGANPERGSTPG